MRRLIGFLAVAALLAIAGNGLQHHAAVAHATPPVRHGHVLPQSDRSAPAEETGLAIADDIDPDRRDAPLAHEAGIEPAIAPAAPAMRLAESPTLQPPGFRKAPTATRAPPRRA